MAEEPAAQMSEEEQTMFRLFRCLDDSEQGEIVRRCLLLLARRGGFDKPRIGQDENEVAQRFERRSKALAQKWHESLEEGEMKALDEEIRAQKPVGCRLSSISLSNLGDPGAWIDDKLDELPFDLFEVPFDYDELSQFLAEEYLTEMHETGFPIPSEFNDDLKTSEDEMWHPQDEEDAREDFDRFLRTWRRKVVEILEKGDK